MRFGVLHLGRSGSGCQMAAAAANQLSRDGHTATLIVHRDYKGMLPIGPRVNPIFVKTYFHPHPLGYFDPVSFLRLRAILKNVGATVDAWYLPLRHLWMPLMLRGLSRSANVVSSVHEVGEKRGERYFAEAFQLQIEAKHSTVLVTHSAWVGSALTRQIGVQTRLAPLSPMQFGPNPAPPEVVKQRVGALRLLFYGRLESYKGLDMTLRAVSAVHDAHPGSVELHLVGRPTPELAERLKDTGPWLQVTPRYADDQELARYIRDTDVVLAPYLDASQSGVIASAFAEYRPVIATNVGGLPEQVDNGRTGLLCCPTVSGLTEAIAHLVKRPDQVLAMSRTIEQNAESIGWGWITPLMVEAATIPK